MRGPKDWMTFTAGAVLMSAGPVSASPVGVGDLTGGSGSASSLESSLDWWHSPMDRASGVTPGGLLASPMDVPALPGTAGAFVGSLLPDRFVGSSRTDDDGFAGERVDFGSLRIELPGLRAGMVGMPGSDLVADRIGGMPALTGTAPIAMRAAFGQDSSSDPLASHGMLLGGRPFPADPFDRANSPDSVVGDAHPDGVSLFVPPSVPLPAPWLAALGLLAPVGIARAIRRRG